MPKEHEHVLGAHFRGTGRRPIVPRDRPRHSAVECYVQCSSAEGQDGVYLAPIFSFCHLILHALPSLLSFNG